MNRMAEDAIWSEAGGRPGMEAEDGERSVSRNRPCPCGSGKKYKKCCWRSCAELERAERATGEEPEAVALCKARFARWLGQRPERCPERGCRARDDFPVAWACEALVLADRG